MKERTTLEEVKQAFDQWRLGKLYQGEHVPKDLRAQIRAIVPYYSQRQITEALGINKEQIDRYVLCNQPTKSGEALTNVVSREFIEVPIPELPKMQPKSAPGLILTITRGDGSSWSLIEATQDVISESLRLFLRG
jgi:hypothetical protein